MAQTNVDSVKTDTVPNLVNDTTVVATDTLTQTLEGDTLQVKPAESNSVISSKINYSASDSIDNDVINKKVYLYGNAKIQYEDITLTAARIVYDFESFTVHAEGVRDTADNWVNLPNFKQGTSEFVSNEMDYNFKSKKAYVRQVQTEIIEGTLTGERVKTVDNNNVVYIRKGEYCPCEDPNAKTRFKIGKLKIIKDKQIVTGPGYLALGKIPTPLVFPFGFFPNSEDRQAGLIVPSYGNGGTKGYFLNDLGFYLPISDYVDTKILGDIYSRGSWGLENLTRYQKRYKFTGGFGVQYNKQVLGDRDLNNYSETNSFFVNWNHKQDMKARPNSNFAASVNAGSTSNFRNDLNASQENYLTNTFQSSISYNKSFYDSPWFFTVQAGHQQNSQTEIYKFTLPEISLDRARTMPLDGLFNDNPKQQFYEKLGITYSANFRNELSVKESELSVNNWPELEKQFKNGIQHNAGASMPLNAGPFTFTPSFRYTERWYFKTYGRAFNDELPGYEPDTISGFDRNYNYSFGTSVSTKLYGMYSFRTGSLKAIRHTLTPALSYSVNPEFDPNIYGFYGDNGTLTRYSPYANSVYSFSGSPRSESLNFSLVNNLEAKVLTRRDTTSKFKKVPIIENIAFNGSYNFAADSMKLSTIRVSGRTKITKYANINFSGAFEPYTYVATDEGSIRRVDVFLRESSGTLASFESGQIALDGSGFGSEMYGRNKTGNTIVPEAGAEGDGDLESITANPIVERPKGFFDEFTVPWHLNFGYKLSANRGRAIVPLAEGFALVDSINIIQSLQFSGDFKVFNRVSFRFNSGYDFVNKELTPTTIYMTVDLNCWEFSARVIPFGERRSYMMTLNIKSSILKDLKFENKGNFGERDQFFQ
ncbi:LPS-assembly protein LptD [Cryomorpha ignava]|uniref:LPS-assembly protein LptD n=1 Tax=Cryomorpha ignava TaxID=101383 RepID=A0A7K3WRP9_9FLAO|nr:putative LPS assembly protein LptD [Cryomorpha ignava]NEN24347.1 LPS-assembly protein LptD [Cryomorpha ignava]